MPADVISDIYLRLSAFLKMSGLTYSITDSRIPDSVEYIMQFEEKKSLIIFNNFAKLTETAFFTEKNTVDLRKMME
jgi:hypothetical protein